MIQKTFWALGYQENLIITDNFILNYDIKT